MAHTIPTKPFRLLSLPDELWVKIGKLAIDQEDDLTEGAFRFSRHDVGFLPSKMPQQPAITRTCKALRDELIPHYYQRKIRLRFSGFNWDLEVVTGRWLRAIGDRNRAQIRGMHFITSAEMIPGMTQDLREAWKLSLEAEDVEQWKGLGRWTIRILS